MLTQKMNTSPTFLVDELGACRDIAGSLMSKNRVIEALKLMKMPGRSSSLLRKTASWFCRSTTSVFRGVSAKNTTRQLASIF